MVCVLACLITYLISERVAFRFAGHLALSSDNSLHLTVPLVFFLLALLRHPLTLTRDTC